MAVIHTVDQAVVQMVATTSMKFSSNVANLITYTFKNFHGSVSIRVDGRHINSITAQVFTATLPDGNYDWAHAEFKHVDRPCVLDKEWMRDLFMAINEIARGNIQAWYDIGVGFRPVACNQEPLKF